MSANGEIGVNPLWVLCWSQDQWLENLWCFWATSLHHTSAYMLRWTSSNSPSAGVCRGSFQNRLLRSDPSLFWVFLMFRNVKSVVFHLVRKQQEKGAKVVEGLQLTFKSMFTVSRHLTRPSADTQDIQILWFPSSAADLVGCLPTLLSLVFCWRRSIHSLRDMPFAKVLKTSGTVSRPRKS